MYNIYPSLFHRGFWGFRLGLFACKQMWHISTGRLDGSWGGAGFPLFHLPQARENPHAAICLSLAFFFFSWVTVSWCCFAAIGCVLSWEAGTDSRHSSESSGWHRAECMMVNSGSKCRAAQLIDGPRDKNVGALLLIKMRLIVIGHKVLLGIWCSGWTSRVTVLLLLWLISYLELELELLNMLSVLFKSLLCPHIQFLKYDTLEQINKLHFLLLV